MTFQKIFDLKYRDGRTTNDLLRQYPKNRRIISEVAMLEMTEETLKEVITEDSTLKRLIRLKRRYFQ